VFNKTFSFIFPYTNLEIFRNVHPQKIILWVAGLLAARILIDLFFLSKEILAESMQSKQAWRSFAKVLQQKN